MQGNALKLALCTSSASSLSPIYTHAVPQRQAFRIAWPRTTRKHRESYELAHRVAYISPPSSKPFPKRTVVPWLNDPFRMVDVVSLTPFLRYARLAAIGVSAPPHLRDPMTLQKSASQWRSRGKPGIIDCGAMCALLDSRNGASRRLGGGDDAGALDFESEHSDGTCESVLVGS
ncbi:hypothetical protein BU26DRAFT_512736 [Trematosphaeria pertusa]|uniref:Uncharacterized protein n=1 Tax=Trematosphaeria pertusa TaxID=390896 RepID=A0A6A6IZI4_9PLEO|nr:uncharacterized protein BU26DRAFT_512736 [Trematosphaeria pertusa]KAF2255776.1 hypothetical protein BU26DRAFT_512736 [Trematosphaeria pertusa]